MSIDLEAINQRYEAALDARPAKGEWTSAQAAILADSVADVKPLMREVEELREQIAQEIEENRPEVGPHVLGSPYRDGRYDGMREAACIARGKES